MTNIIYVPVHEYRKTESIDDILCTENLMGCVGLVGADKQSGRRILAHIHNSGTHDATDWDTDTGEADTIVDALGEYLPDTAMVHLCYTPYEFDGSTYLHPLAEHVAERLEGYTIRHHNDREYDGQQLDSKTLIATPSELRVMKYKGKKWLNMRQYQCHLW